MKNWKKFCLAAARPRIVLFLAVLLSLGAAVLSLCLGAASFSVSQLWQAFSHGTRSGTAGYILWFVRIPRTAACLLAGAGLSVAGAVIQGVLGNKLASPGIIGVNAGAGLAVTLSCALGVFSGWAVAGAAFLGALCAVLLVTVTAWKVGASRTTVILGGVAVNAFLNAISEGIINLIPDAGMMSSDFRVGGFSAVSHVRLVPAGILIMTALALLLTLCNELDVLALGDDTARGLGMRTWRMRILFLFLAAMLAGASVSFAGLLGFVGLIVPHAARSLAGGESRRLLPLCAVGGAGFVTACDLIARLAFAPFELPVGILMSLLGGPFFIFLLRRGKRGERRDG